MLPKIHNYQKNTGEAGETIINQNIKKIFYPHSDSQKLVK
jgi:hypothetical protein